LSPQAVDSSHIWSRLQIYSQYVCVCVRLCCEIYSLLCPLLCHCSTSNMGGRTDRCHTHTHSPKTAFTELTWKMLQSKWTKCNFH